jgi:hypothetical protein
MRTYTITGPDGKDYSIDGPEGATREQVIAKIKERMSSQPIQAAQKQDPYTETAQKQSIGENLLAGAGGGLYGMYLGAKQLLGKATPEELEDHKKAIAGLRSTTAGTVGDIGGQVVGAIPAAFIPGANTYVGAGLIGSGLGALQPTTKEGERSNNMIMGGIGGVAGQGIGRGIGKLLKPVPRSIDNSVGVNAANRIGMQLTSGDITGSTGLNQVEAVLKRTPGSAGMFDRIKDLNQGKINAAAAKAIGENADNLGEDVIAKASQRISQTFNDLSAKSKVSLDDDFTKLITKLQTNNEKLGSFRNPQVDSLIAKSTELAQMKDIPGDVYQVIRSELTSSADDAYRAGNSAAGKAMKDIRNALDTSAKKGLSEADQATWDAVRSQYAHLKTLVKGNTIEAGNVKPHLINGALAKFNPQMYKSGQINSPLNDIGVVAQQFKQAVPNSGTPERTAMQNMMFGNPITGVPSMALANAYARAYLSKPGQAYMTKGMVDLSPQVQQLLAKSGMLLGGVGGSNLNK